MIDTLKMLGLINLLAFLTFNRNDLENCMKLLDDLQYSKKLDN